MADDKHDRDKLSRKTPPKGVASQIAGPVNRQPISKPQGEDFDSHTPTHPTPVHGMTTGGETMLAAAERRTRDIKNTSLSTLQLVGSLRDETDKKLERLDQKIEKQNDVLRDLSRAVERAEGQNEVIIDLVKQQQTLIITKETTELEIRKHRAMTDVDLDKLDRTERAEARQRGSKVWWTVFREFGLRAAAGTGFVAVIVLIVKECR